MVTPNQDLQAFARSLRAARRARDLSQEALAERAGLSAKHVSDIERANKDPRLTTLMKLVDALDLAIEDLFPQRSRTAGGSRSPHVA